MGDDRQVSERNGATQALLFAASPGQDMSGPSISCVWSVCLRAERAVRSLILKLYGGFESGLLCLLAVAHSPLSPALPLPLPPLLGFHHLLVRCGGTPEKDSSGVCRLAFSSFLAAGGKSLGNCFFSGMGGSWTNSFSACNIFFNSTLTEGEIQQ